MANTPTPTPRQLARYALRGTVWLTIGNYFNQVIGFVAVLILTRLLAPEVFGAFVLATFWAGLLNVRVKLGLIYSAVQYPTTEEWLGTYFAIDLAAAGASLLLAGVMAVVFMVTRLYSLDVITAILLLVFVDGAAAFASAQGMALEKELSLSRLSMVSLIANSLAYLTALGLAWSGAGLWSVLSISVVIGSVSLIGTRIIYRQQLPLIDARQWRFKASLAKEFIAKGISIGLAVAALTIIGAQYDNFLIGTFINKETLGFYDRAYRIAQWPNVLLLLVISKVGFLTFAKFKDDLPRLTHSIRLSLWMLFGLGIPMNLALFFAAHDLVTLLYGLQWEPSVRFLQFFSFSNWLWALINIGFWLSVAKGDWRKVAYLSGVHAGLMIAVATPLTWAYGVTGTLLGVLISMLVAFGLNGRYLFQQVPLRLVEIFGPPFVSALLTGTGLWLLTHLPQWDNLAVVWRVLLIAVTALGLFTGGLFVLRRAETVERIRYLAQVWRARPTPTG